MEEKFLHAEGPGAGRNLPFRTKADLNSKSAGKTFAAFDPAKLQGKYTLGRAERLKSKKIIDQLFKEGKSVAQNGFTLVYLNTPLRTMYPAQAGFAVAKKHFKNAVDRNRIKRLMREAYRLNKHPLYEALSLKRQQLAIMWVYNGKTLPTQQLAATALTACLKKLSKA